ncbi:MULTISPECIES: hypothetical protein [unclassified Roseibium]|uniref:hypothetical protein n=1 Tax=unclassified Roseibium TaxID=2629323 RepID=UPI00273E6102|nr:MULTISPECIES: hypothetical protein [unclassified Roseibium]
MVEIIAFPGKIQSTTVDTSRLNLEGAASCQDLQVMPVPQISSTLDGTVVVSPSETADNFPEGDWTNQELADLYRVESLLVQAGIKMSTGRGVTDENDPWFVFCREDGDVFVHLARADGRYLLDSPGLSGLLEGPDFATLIDTFVKQLAALRAPDDDSNVVSFRPKMLRDKSVHLHPSILLAALIWTLYLASDDIASATEAASDLAEDMILPVDKLLMMDQSDTGTGDIEATDIDGTAPDLAKVKTAVANPTAQTAVSFADADRSGSDRLVSSFSAMIASASPAAQAVSASLAIIAFSFGFYGQNKSEIVETEGETGFSIAGLHSALRQLAETGIETVRLNGDQHAVEISASAEAGPVVLADLNGELDLQTAEIVDYELHLADLNSDLTVAFDGQAEVAAEDGATVQANMGEKHQPAGHAAEVQSETKEKASAPAKKVADEATTPAASKEESKQQASSEPASEDKFVVAEVLDTLSSGSAFGSAMVSTTLDWDGFEQILDQLDVATSVVSEGPDLDTDLAAVSGINLGSKELGSGDDGSDTIGSTPSSGVDMPSLPEAPSVSVVGAEILDYDQRVTNFITSFIHNNDSIEIVHFQTELVIIDMSAIGNSASHTYARSWITDEGHVISTVGSYQDFLDYGMA